MVKVIIVENTQKQLANYYRQLELFRQKKMRVRSGNIDDTSRYLKKILFPMMRDAKELIQEYS